MPSLGAVVADGPDRTQKRGGTVEREVVETSEPEQTGAKGRGHRRGRRL